MAAPKNVIVLDDEEDDAQGLSKVPGPNNASDHGNGLEAANPVGQAGVVSGSNPVAAGRNTKHGQGEKSPLFTPKFFSDMADEVLANFPYKGFAASHNCSTEDVNRALMATVFSTLLAKNATSVLLEAGADFQAQMEAWEGQYGVMARMLNAGEDTVLHKQLDQAVAANQHNAEGLGNASEAGQGGAGMAVEDGGTTGVIAPAGPGHDELALPPVDPALIDPQLLEDSTIAPTCDESNVPNNASSTEKHYPLQHSDDKFSSLQRTPDTNLKKRSRSDENETPGVRKILISVPEFPNMKPSPKRRRLNPTKVTNTRPWLQSALQKMYLRNGTLITAYRKENAVRNVSETLALAVASAMASQPLHHLLDQQEDTHAELFPMSKTDPATRTANQWYLRFPELSRRKRMYRDNFGCCHLTQAEEERETQRLLGRLPPQPALTTGQLYVSLPGEHLRTGQGDGKVTNEQGKTLFETATKKDIEWWKKNFKGKKDTKTEKTELNRKRKR